MVDEKTPIDPPDIPVCENVRFNVLLAHLFAVLSKSQSMSLLQVNPCQHNTVQDIVTCVFPAITASNNKPTPAITPMTIGYIHALVMDTLTFNSTEAPYARALVNQAVIVGELDKLTPAAFQTELRNCLVDYYENVCLMVGAGGALSIPTHKRKFKAAATTSAGVEEAAGQPPRTGNQIGVRQAQIAADQRRLARQARGAALQELRNRDAFPPATPAVKRRRIGGPGHAAFEHASPPYFPPGIPVCGDGLPIAACTLEQNAIYL